ncbi:MAG TPA: class I SAM-dependent methyltransferase [Candidatus Hydrogenedentes bacterium]|nr:class I SAM-dependent methyltransferase [Candidatus Hydrogenedentota bacterium]HOS02172.1 class I SAM-dependent methyltransferase [Candidatus Hydrogenedentota bacterium]
MPSVKKSFYTTVDHDFEVEHVEEVACNLCDATAYDVLAQELGFDIRECSNCGLVYVSPQPAANEIKRFYEGMYTSQTAADAATRSIGAVERHLKRVVFARKPEGGRLLEIGCGYGNFLRQFVSPRWILTGVETATNALAHVRRTVPGVTLVEGTVEESDFPPASQDCIVMIAVLEHMKDPKGVLARVTRWLAPGGILLVQTPYIANFIRAKRWFPKLPIHFEAPRHLFDFSPSTLPRYFAEAGLRDIRTEIARPYSSAGPLGTLLIWGVKAPGLLLYALTGGRYVYPYSSAIVVHGVRERA